jgi:hypothetical protein
MHATPRALCQTDGSRSHLPAIYRGYLGSLTVGRLLSIRGNPYYPIGTVRSYSVATVDSHDEMPSDSTQIGPAPPAQ